MIKHGYDKAEGVGTSGLPLFVRITGSVAIGYLMYGLAAESIADKAILIGAVVAVAVFALLAIVNRIAIRAE